MKKVFLIALAAFFAAACSERTDSLSEGFRTPPDSIRTAVYWYWLNNNISKEGVVKDLQAYSEKLLQENRRLKPVDIRSCPGYNKDHKTIHVGSQSLSLSRVKTVIE